MSGPFYVGQRVRLRVDVHVFRAGDTGRVLRADRAPSAAGEAIVYLCEIDTPQGTRLAALCPEEIEPVRLA
jgi:hypothetical protein